MDLVVGLPRVVYKFDFIQVISLIGQQNMFTSCPLILGIYWKND